MPKILAGWNMPGYLPVAEPVEFDTFAEAGEYLANEIMTVADAADDDVDECDAAAHQALRLGEPGHVTFRDHVYWMTYQ